MSRGNSEDSVTLKISRRTYKLIKLFISEREKGIFKKGMIREVVENAVLRHITQHDTHAHFHKDSSKMKALDLKQKIIDHLISKYRYESLDSVRIAKRQLMEAIIAVEGCTDSRAINGRINLLKSKSCIKESDNKLFIFLSDSNNMKKEEGIK